MLGAKFSVKWIAAISSAGIIKVCAVPVDLPRGGLNCVSLFFSTDSSFLPFHLCPCPLSVSLVTINGNFHPFLVSVISITAMRGKIARTSAASKMVVIPKWFPSLPITSRPPLAALGATRHRCNAAVLCVWFCCLPVLSLDNSCRGVPCHCWLSLTHQHLLNMREIGIFQHFSC